MNTKLFELADFEIWNRNGKFFAHYDAGSHLVQMREDEIFEDEVRLALSGKEELRKMRLNLQQRLIKSGINPYITNLPEE